MNTPDFDARARDIVNGYGYLCADRMNDWNILQFASIVSAALLQAFEAGKAAQVAEEEAAFQRDMAELAKNRVRI